MKRSDRLWLAGLENDERVALSELVRRELLDPNRLPELVKRGGLKLYRSGTRLEVRADEFLAALSILAEDLVLAKHGMGGGAAIADGSRRPN